MIRYKFFGRFIAQLTTKRNTRLLEKMSVALVWATQKLRHYILTLRVLLIARMDPLKYLIKKPMKMQKTQNGG